MEQSTCLIGAELGLDMVLPFQSQSRPQTRSPIHLIHYMTEEQMTPPLSPSPLLRNQRRRSHLSKLLRKSRSRLIRPNHVDQTESRHERTCESAGAGVERPGFRLAGTQREPPFRFPLLLPDSPPVTEEEQCQEGGKEEDSPASSTSLYSPGMLRRMSTSYHDLRAMAQAQGYAVPVPSRPAIPLLPSPIPRDAQCGDDGGQQSSYFFSMHDPPAGLSFSDESRNPSPQGRGSMTDDELGSFDSDQILAYYCNDSDALSGGGSSGEGSADHERMGADFSENLNARDVMAHYPGEDLFDADVVDDDGPEGNEFENEQFWDEGNEDAYSTSSCTASDLPMPVTPSEYNYGHDTETRHRDTATAAFCSSDESGWLANTTSHEERRRRFKARLYQVVQHPWSDVSAHRRHGGSREWKGEGEREGQVMIATVLIGVGPGKPRLVQIQRPPSSSSNQSRLTPSTTNCKFGAVAPIESDLLLQVRDTSPTTVQTQGVVEPLDVSPRPSTPVQASAQAGAHQPPHEVSAFSPYDTPGPGEAVDEVEDDDKDASHIRPQARTQYRDQYWCHGTLNSKRRSGHSSNIQAQLFYSSDDQPAFETSGVTGLGEQDVSSSHSSSLNTSLLPPPLNLPLRSRSSRSDGRGFSACSTTCRTSGIPASLLPQRHLQGLEDPFASRLSMSPRRSRSHQSLRYFDGATNWTVRDTDFKLTRAPSDPETDNDTNWTSARTVHANDTRSTRTIPSGISTNRTTIYHHAASEAKEAATGQFSPTRNTSPSEAESPTPKVAAWSRCRRLARVLEAVTQAVVAFPDRPCRLGLDSPAVLEMRRHWHWSWSSTDAGSALSSSASGVYVNRTSKTGSRSLADRGQENQKPQTCNSSAPDHDHDHDHDQEDPTYNNSIATHGQRTQTCTIMEAFHKIFPSAPTPLLSALAAWIITDLYLTRILVEGREWQQEERLQEEQEAARWNIDWDLRRRRRRNGAKGPWEFGFTGFDDELYSSCREERLRCRETQEPCSSANRCHCHYRRNASKRIPTLNGCLHHTAGAAGAATLGRGVDAGTAIPDKARRTLGIRDPPMSMAKPSWLDRWRKDPYEQRIWTWTPAEQHILATTSDAEAMDAASTSVRSDGVGIHQYMDASDTRQHYTAMRHKAEAIRTCIPAISRPLVEALRGTWDEDVWRSLKVLVEVIIEKEERC